MYGWCLVPGAGPSVTQCHPGSDGEVRRPEACVLQTPLPRYHRHEENQPRTQSVVADVEAPPGGVSGSLRGKGQEKGNTPRPPLDWTEKHGGPSGLEWPRRQPPVKQQGKIPNWSGLEKGKVHSPLME